MSAVVGADLAELVALADRLASAARRADELLERARLANERLRRAWLPDVDGGTFVHRPATCVASLATLEHGVGAVRRAARGARRTAEDLAAADRAAARATAAVDAWDDVTGRARRLDDLLEVRLHEVPGLGWVPGVELREVGAAVDDAGWAVDDWRGGRVAARRQVLLTATLARARRVGAAATRVWGLRGTATTVARVADQLGRQTGRVRAIVARPGVRPAARMAGRAVAGLGVAVTAADTVDAFRQGDTTEGLLSAAETVGGVAMLISAPAVVAVGAVVVAGVVIYRHREAIARAGRRAGRAVVRGARDVARRARAVAARADDVLGGARAALGMGGMILGVAGTGCRPRIGGRSAGRRPECRP